MPAGSVCYRWRADCAAAGRTEAPMTTSLLTLLALTMTLLQQSEPVISKDEISIHAVRRGDMRLRLILQGGITSLQPPKAAVSGPLNAAVFLNVGQTVDFEVQGRRIGGNLPV